MNPKTTPLKSDTGRKQALSLLIMTGVITAIVSFVVATLVFHSINKADQVPVPPVVSSDFPDVYNDPVYTSFLNNKALDPTLPVQIGGSKNSHPFNQ